MSVQRVRYSREELILLEPLCISPPVIPEPSIAILRRFSICAVSCPLGKTTILSVQPKKKTITSSISYLHLNIRSLRSREKFEAFEALLTCSNVLTNFFASRKPSSTIVTTLASTTSKDTRRTVKIELEVKRKVAEDYSSTLLCTYR